jgi:hypothetical protein
MSYHRTSDQRGSGRETVEARKRQRRRLRPTLLALEDRRLLSTFTVNSTGDSGTGSGLVGDLRYCINQANSAGGDETIVFDSTVFNTPQTITLTQGQLELSDTTGPETITGPAGGVTVNGNNTSRVFQIDEGVTASISGLTITGGSTGYFQYGAGVFNEGTTTLTNCTISGNTARPNYIAFGGGLATGGGATTTLTNCTVSGNYSGGVSTNRGTTTLINTIVAGNDSDISGTVSGSYNLIGTGGSGGLSNEVDGNIVGVANPGLTRLGNYGGTCQTIALLPGSPAIDTGTSTGAPATDQRGFARVGAVDIGAFESQGFTLTPVAGSTPQSADIGTPFANPLAVTVTANNPVEPVDGGVINFVGNPVSGATAILSAPSAVIAGGQAATTAAPNNALGSYTVTASATGSSPGSFDLTNTGTPFAALVVNTTSDSLFPGAGLLSLPEAVAFGTVHPTPH